MGRICLIVAICLSACRTIGPSSNVTASSTTSSPTGALDQCELAASFILEAKPSMPVPSLSHPTIRIKSVAKPAVPPSPKRNIEIEVCLTKDGSKVTSVRGINYIHEKENVIGSLRLEPAGKWVVNGLNEALFGDYSKLEIVVAGDFLDENSMISPAIKLHVKGWSEGGQDFVTAGLVEKFKGPETAPSELTYGEPTIVGDLVAGNLLGKGKCKSFETDMETTIFRIGTAKFQIDYCGFYSMDDSMPKRVVGLKLKDDSPSLPRPIDIVMDDAEVARHIKVANAHHGHYFGFLLQLDDVSYAVRERQFGDGFFTAEASFFPKFVEISPTMGTQYRVKYGTGNWDLEHKTPMAVLKNRPGTATALSQAQVLTTDSTGGSLTATACDLPPGSKFSYTNHAPKEFTGPGTPTALRSVDRYIELNTIAACGAGFDGLVYVSKARFKFDDLPYDQLPEFKPDAPPGCTLTTVKYPGEDGANVRDTPSTNGELVETLFLGDLVAVCETKPGWKKVALLHVDPRSAFAVDGWIKDSLVN